MHKIIAQHRKENRFRVYLWYFKHPEKGMLPLFVQFPQWSLTKEEEDVRVIMSAKRVKCVICIPTKEIIKALSNS